MYPTKRVSKTEAAPSSAPRKVAEKDEPESSDIALQVVEGVPDGEEIVEVMGKNRLALNEIMLGGLSLVAGAGGWGWSDESLLA